MGRRSNDLDITVPRNGYLWAGELAQLLDGTFVPMDADEDVARVVWQNFCIDISSFREGAGTITEDLAKRDFTINSMAILLPGQAHLARNEAGLPEILDPAGGRQDLQDGIIRSTSAAVFISDPLRLLRAYRFMATFGFRIDHATAEQINEHIHLLFLVAEERIAYELEAIMAVEESIITVRAMHENGVLGELVPELYRGVGVEQPDSHHLDVFEHGIVALGMMEAVQKDPGRYFPGQEDLFTAYLQDNKHRVLLKWAALFHDLGKPATREIREEKNGRITFYNHDREGARIFTIIAERFRWPRDDREFVRKLISYHMWPFHLNNARRQTGVTPKAYLRLIKAVGQDFPALFMLAMADSLAGRGAGKPPAMEEDVADLFSEVQSVYAGTIEPVLTKRLLTGNDLKEIFKLEPGPMFSDIFDALESARVEGEVRNREGAISWVKNYLKSHM
jgi:poly(A) polymerase